MTRVNRRVLVLSAGGVAGAIRRPGGNPPMRTQLGIDGTRFTIDGRPTFLYGISYYGAIAAPEATWRADLAEMRRRRFNWLRLWANWNAFGADAAAVDAEGNPRPDAMARLAAIVAECDRLGLVVDVTLSRGNGVTGPPRLQTLADHRRAVEALVTTLRQWRNWYLDLANERNLRDRRYVPIDHLAALRARVRELDPDRLVTASHAGDLAREALREYLVEVPVDFVAPHRPRNADSPRATAARTREWLAEMQRLGRSVPVHYQEPFRRGFGAWEPTAEDFVTDLRGALDSGAAGWCFHNGDQRAAPDGRPRRSFDLREGSLFQQLDDVEREALRRLKAVIATGKTSP